MPTVQSIDRAFAILRRLASGAIGVTELAERVDLPKSTVSRLLSTLEAIGAVEQTTPGGPYRIGPAMVEMVNAVRPSRNLLDAAHPHLLELTQRTEEASGLGVLLGSEVHYIDQVESRNPVQVRDWTGTRVPLHAVPSGLVLLAYSTEEYQRAYLARDLVAFTHRTVTDSSRIAERLQRIRADGFAWVHEEFSDGINSVAAPIFDTVGAVIGAVHAHGPAYRFPKPNEELSVAAEIVGSARRISAALGL
jgi:IclR family transcriptional regulator, KDG regulon repressor